MAEGPEESGLGMLVAAAEQELPSLEVGVQSVRLRFVAGHFFVLQLSAIAVMHIYFTCVCGVAMPPFGNVHGVIIQPYGKSLNNSCLQVYSCSHHFPL